MIPNDTTKKQINKPKIDEEADFFDTEEDIRVETEMKLHNIGKNYLKYYLPETIWNLDGLVMLSIINVEDNLAGYPAGWNKDE